MYNIKCSNIKEYNYTKIDFLFIWLIIFSVILVNLTKLDLLYNILILILSISIFYKPIYGLLFYLFSMAFEGYLFIAPKNNLSSLIGIIFIFSILLKLLQKKNININFKLIFLLLFIILVNLIPTFFSSFLINDLLSNLIVLFEIMIFLAIIYIPISDLEFNKYLGKFFLYLLIILCIFVNIFGVRIGGRLTLGESINPNQFAINLSIIGIIAFNIFFLERRKKLYSYILGILIFTFFLWTLFRTGSRSCLFGIFIGLLFSIIFYNKKVKFKMIFIFLILLLFISSMLLITFDREDLEKRFYYKNIIYSQSGGRFEIWKGSWENIITKNILFGIGISGRTSELYIGGYSGLYKPSHNILLSILIRLGIIGLFSYGIFYFFIFLRGLRSISKIDYNFPFFIAFITAIFIGIGETIFMEELLWVTLGLIWRFSRNPLNEKSEKVNG